MSAYLFCVKISAIWLAMSETSRSSEEGWCCIGIVYPAISSGLHCFVWKGKRLACGFHIRDWRALEGFKENYHCWGDVTSSTAGLRCCRGWCEIHLFSYRWKWPRKRGTVFIPTREPETSRHHCSYPPASSLDLTWLYCHVPGGTQSDVIWTCNL